MKKLLFVLMTVLFFCACHKKTETPSFSTLIVGKWGCDSYKKDGSDTIVNRQPYSLAGRYEQGWEFLADKKIRYKYFNSWDDKPDDGNSYELQENRTLILTQAAGTASSMSRLEIIELSEEKLTVYNSGLNTTFFLLKEQ
jgi:Lipocalin-like domain